MKNLENTCLYSSCKKYRHNEGRGLKKMHHVFLGFHNFPYVFPRLREAQRFFRRHVLHPIRGLAGPGSWGACIASTGSSDLGAVIHGTVGY